MRRRAINSSMVLANQTVQVSTEAKARPTITALTTISAAMNMPQGDKSRGSLSAISVEAADGWADGGAAGTGSDGAGATCWVEADGEAVDGDDGSGGVVCPKSRAG